MKAVVIYYSKTGNTEKVAKKITELFKNIDADAECVSIDRSERRTYEDDVKEAKRGVKAKIESIMTDLSKVDLLFIGSPVWCGKPATPINTYMDQCEGLNSVNIVCFVTHGGGGPGNTFDIMKTKLGSKGGEIVGTLSISSNEIDEYLFTKEVKEVISKLKG